MPPKTRAIRIDGPLIRHLRETGGKSQGKFAFRVEVSISYLSRIENGDRNPSPEITLRIAEALGVTVEKITTTEPK